MKVVLIRNVRESRNLSMMLYADRLENELEKHCSVINVSFEPDFAYQIAGIMGFRVQDYVGRFWSFPRQLRNIQADIFHIVDHANAHLIRALDPERTVITCHDLMLLKLAAGEIPWDGRKPKIAGITFRWSINYLSRAAAVLCDSESTKLDVERLIGCTPERIHVVYLGLQEMFRQIFDDKLLAEARMRFGLKWPITILHVGNSIFYKNLESVIEALGLLSKTWRDDVHLVKVGEDFTPGQWKLIHRRDLGKRVHFIGQLNIQDLVLLYNLANILLFPSLYEGFGWPPLEAMACGTPVVCSDCGSLKEVVGDAAFIVDPEDPKVIAEGVEQVLTDFELQKLLITRGLERVKRFSWKTTAEQTLNVYREVTGIRKTSSSGVV